MRLIRLLFPFTFLTLTFWQCNQNDQMGERQVATRKVDSTYVNYYEPVEIDLDSIMKRGVLNAIVDNSSTSYFIYKGEPMGYEYDLLKRFTEFLGVELNLIVITDIEEAIHKLNEGEGDVIGYNFTVTKQRRDYLNFMDHHYTVRQVLVQPLPENWRKLKKHETERQLIRNQVNLVGKEIHVRKGSSYAQRLVNLSNEIGGDIRVIEGYEDKDTETLVRMVAEGEIPMTVADEDIAKVSANYHRNIDIKTPISFPQPIAWAVRLTSNDLLEKLNEWWDKEQKKPDVYVLYDRYFESPRSSMQRVKSEYASISGSKISPYDDIIKKYNDELGWDWKLLASQMYQESKFKPKTKSWAGAMGLMQLVPSTARRFGASNPMDPEQNIRAGIRYLEYLDQNFFSNISDSTERVKFILASYNVGQGHVLDAIRLTEKYDRDPTVWDDNVEYFLERKSQAKYYNDPVVNSGYCRGSEPVKYVREILTRYEQYKTLIQDENVAAL